MLISSRLSLVWLLFWLLSDLWLWLFQSDDCKVLQWTCTLIVGFCSSCDSSRGDRGPGLSSWEVESLLSQAASLSPKRGTLHCWSLLEKFFSALVCKKRKKALETNKNKTGVINDPLGQTHSVASSYHYFPWKLFCLTRFWNVVTDGRHVWHMWSLPAQIVGRPGGSKHCLSWHCMVV